MGPILSLLFLRLYVWGVPVSPICVRRLLILPVLGVSPLIVHIIEHIRVLQQLSVAFL